MHTRLSEDMQQVDPQVLELLSVASGGGTIGLRQAEHVIRMLRQNGLEIVKVRT